MTRKQRRLVQIGASLAVLGLAAALVLSALRESIESRERTSCGRRVHGCDASRMSGSPGVQELQRFGSANFSNHDAVGTCPKSAL